MGFNGSGTFSRLYSWVSDAASAIAISSSRMDADTNDIATGLSNVICKDGQTTTTAAIPFAQGVKVSDGTVGAPSIAFTSDTVTGIYHKAANNIGIAANGAEVIDVTTSGASVTGNLSASGNLSVTGNVTVTGSITNLSNVTNDTQTKAAIVPNTAPSAGKILVGNAGGTAYAPVSVSGDATLSSAGALVVTKTNGTAFATVATSGSYNDLTNKPLGTTKYISSTISLATVNGTDFTHGLGAVPTIVQVRLTCTTADAGYSVGDIMITNPSTELTGASNSGLAVVLSTTVVHITVASQGINAINKSTGALVTLTAANWSLQVVAILVQ